MQAARRTEGRANDQTWMGDVFKVVPLIDTFARNTPASHSRAMARPWWLPLPKATQDGCFGSVDAIERLTYVDVLLLRDSLLAPVSSTTC